jgi:hypothetical protein
MAISAPPLRSCSSLPPKIRTALSAKFYEEPGFEEKRARVTASRRIGEPTGSDHYPVVTEFTRATP